MQLQDMQRRSLQIAAKLGTIYCCHNDNTCPEILRRGNPHFCKCNADLNGNLSPKW